MSALGLAGRQETLAKKSSQKKAAKRREERLMSNTIATDSLFSADERDALKVLVGMIVPASAVHNVPGADDELIFADILDSARANEAQIRKCAEHAVSCGLGDGLE